LTVNCVSVIYRYRRKPKGGYKNMVAIYARQSVFKEDSLSIETQIEKYKLHLEEGETFKVYKDAGYSGKIRPGLNLKQ